MHKGDTWWLHLPFTERVPIRGKAEARRISESDLKVGTVDLNVDSTVAAAWEGPRCRGVRTFWHARETDRRERLPRKVAREQRRSGTPIKGERGNRNLWRSIINLDTALAWHIAPALVAWAVAAGIQVKRGAAARGWLRPPHGPTSSALGG